MNQFEYIYDILLNRFGPQGWWPIKGRYNSKEHDPFEIIVGAILTQNTSWNNVEKALNNLEKAHLISIKKIKSIGQKRLAELIRPAGYYNQKSERLKIVADFFEKSKSPTRAELLEVKGIGPETADSILLYAFNQPVFVIDAYTKRIFSRIGLCKDKCTYDELHDLFHTNLTNDYKIFNEYHALLVELAKRYCKKKPDCINCPVNQICKKFI